MACEWQTVQPLERNTTIYTLVPSLLFFPSLTRLLACLANFSFRYEQLQSAASVEVPFGGNENLDFVSLKPSWWLREMTEKTTSRHRSKTPSFTHVPHRCLVSQLTLPHSSLMTNPLARLCRKHQSGRSRGDVTLSLNTFVGVMRIQSSRRRQIDYDAYQCCSRKKENKNSIHTFHAFKSINVVLFCDWI